MCCVFAGFLPALATRSCSTQHQSSRVSLTGLWFHPGSLAYELVTQSSPRRRSPPHISLYLLEQQPTGTADEGRSKKMDGGSTKINGHCVKMDNRFVKMNDPSKKRGGLNFLCLGIKRFRAAKASKMLVEYEKGPFHFLQLSRELRDHVCSYALQAPSTTNNIIGTHFDFRGYCSDLRPPTPNIVLVNRQLYQEAREIL